MMRTFFRRVTSREYRRSFSMMKALQDGDWHSASTLLMNGADVEFRDPLGRTPLLYAIEMNQLPWATFLLNIGANPNVADFEHNCAFLTACRTRNVEMARAIIEGGLAVTAPFRVGPIDNVTPLHAAVVYGMPAIVERLIEAGANPTASCFSDGNGPMEYVSFDLFADSSRIIRDPIRDLATIRVLMKAGAKPDTSVIGYACANDLIPPYSHRLDLPA